MDKTEHEAKILAAKRRVDAAAADFQAARDRITIEKANSANLASAELTAAYRLWDQASAEYSDALITYSDLLGVRQGQIR
jgi:hypothetical protein